MLDELIENVFGLSQPIKIRDYLKNKLGFSTSLIAKVKFNNVILNGEPVHMRAMVKNGDIIRVLFPTEESENIFPIDIPLEVIYEDEDIIAINKPTNMPVHPCRGNSLPTLANALRHYLGRPFVFRSVNRLDRDTSGIVLVAKNQLSCIQLSRQMQANSMTKIYYAVVEGEMPEHGTIHAPIAREAPDSLRRIVREDGKDSLTEYELIERTEDGNSLLRITLHTGRTHQIRVHMAHIGHPLVNDFMYGTQRGDEMYRLHCAELSFVHPRTGRQITLKCEIPT